MRELTICSFLTLDGVAQAPGGPNEDREGGFNHGGWLVPFACEEMGPLMIEWFARADAFVLGRKTWEIFAAHWPNVSGDPIADALNGLPKYVASHTRTSGAWSNTRFTSDPIETVKALKQESGKHLQVHGSCTLAKQLIKAGIVDRYLLWFHPLVLGQGKKLFPIDAPSRLELVRSISTPTGVVVNEYVAGGAVQTGSFAIN
jgi:dihydrofolate reductase